MREASLLDELLSKSSRTFALAIPMLPEPTCREVSIAYLLMRVADTLEDSTRWASQRRIQELGRYSKLLQAPSLDIAHGLSSRWLEDRPLDEAGYLDLIAALPRVIVALSDLPKASQEIISRYTSSTADQMAIFQERTDESGRLELETLDDLRAYCHAVAGIVGAMLTELFLLEREELALVASPLRRGANAFGEGLQLVNILKDAASDLAEGRSYLPSQVDRADIFALARRDLEVAREYVGLLADAGTDRGLVEFTALITLLGGATLERVARDGSGAKIGRNEVATIVAQLRATLDRDPSRGDLFQPFSSRQS